jgi:SAM-dependent methyltransferase
MKTFEYTYLLAEPFMPTLHQEVRRRLLQFSRSRPQPAVLDVGGRKSHYTIGIPARITISELRRESDLQKKLGLGLTSQIAGLTLARRSNLERVIFDDMTKSSLPDAAFDCVTAVEVLEHVEDDQGFVAEVFRVLRPGGLFLMTTPNGDSVVNHNPDHKRHYRRAELESLLARHFGDVAVEYGVRGGKAYSLALRSWSLRHPLRTAVTMVAALTNSVQSRNHGIQDCADDARKLFGIARKLN